MEKDLYILIVGCGRLGSYLANRLSHDGNSVVVVDVDDRAFSNLAPEYGGFRVEGDATELAVLRQAKMEKADVVIAATRDDNVNLMVAQIAVSFFSVRRVLARVFDPAREAVYRQLGIVAICPTTLAADDFLRSVGTEAQGKPP